jgi:hypothetical protein
MGAATRRARLVGRGSIAVLFAVVALLGAEIGVRPQAPHTPVAEVTGGDWGEKLACFGCASTILAVSGSTIGALVFYATLFPEAYGACGFICYTAFA